MPQEECGYMLKEVTIEQKILIEIDGEDSKILSIESKTVDEKILNDIYTDNHVLTATELRYGIITLGKKNNVGQALPKGQQVYVEIEECNVYTLNTHKSTIGRIDGFTKIFRENEHYFLENQAYAITFDVKKNLLKINTI